MKKVSGEGGAVVITSLKYKVKSVKRVPSNVGTGRPFVKATCAPLQELSLLHTWPKLPRLCLLVSSPVSDCQLSKISQDHFP